MSLTPETRLGPYEVLGAIGAGGMGEVYRARDTKLNRVVAIKVLPEAFARDAERLARFTREAQMLAALNHPNIAHIYGLEEAGPVRALVMELVEGEDLSARIARGPLPPGDALPIARQIAEALETAHEQGIIHRDLKPANIKVRADGTVKVLDFGLAKAMEPVSGPRVDLANSPTITTPAMMTGAGMILGTAAYMAPEQARGKAVDKRADIWAFGVVLYEMLTGRRAFEGEEISDVLASVLTRDPNLTALPGTTPASVRQLLGRCLDKDPKRRLRDIGEARLQLDNAIAGRPDASSAATPAAISTTLPRSRVLWLAVPIASLVAASAAWFVKPATSAPAIRLSIALAAGDQVTTPPAISRDGRMVAYAAGHTGATSKLYLRTLEDFTPRVVADSAGALLPFFSPDGRSIAFFAGGKLRRAPVTGGAATVLTSTPDPRGGVWSDDGRLVYVPGFTAGIWRIAEEGGTPEQLTKPDGVDAGYSHTFPQRLPGTDDLLFSFWGRTFYEALLSTKTKTWRPVTADLGSFLFAAGTYTSSGHLLLNDGAGGVRAAAWTSGTATLARPETVVLDNVHWVASGEPPWIRVADNGSAIYVRSNPSDRHLVWVDRQGRASQLPGDASLFSHASVSRDGRRVTYGFNQALWVEDLATGARTRVLSDVSTITGVWLPGDERIVVSSPMSGDWELYTVGTHGHSEPKLLLKKRFTQHPLDAAPDGTVVYLERHPVTGADLWTLAPDGKTSPLVVTPFNETSARVSADGRYVAYVSDESGRNEIYAVPMSGKGDRVTVSIEGGNGPVWSRDGRELFYRAGDDLMSVDVRMTPSLVLGERRKLLDLSAYDPAYFHEFDVSADGQKFLLIRTDSASRPVRLDVMLNWFEELKSKMNSVR
jgi:Tol biopolymer transport system component